MRKTIDGTETKWTKDVWAEEMTAWTDKNHPLPSEVRATFDSVPLTTENAKSLVQFKILRNDDLKYDLISYMQQHWND